MKHKKPSVLSKPWTTFQQIYLTGEEDAALKGAASAALKAMVQGNVADYVNSRYHVGVWEGGGPQHPMGKWYHLSIKDHDRSARHDWRDLQRIKNELVGPEYMAIEIYPPESQLVDTSNQYHLFVFESWRAPMAFPERLVADAEGASRLAPKAKQRPFEVRPADCLTAAELDARVEQSLK